MFGTNAPIWMTKPGPVYVRKHVRDKYDRVVKEMDLLNANPLPKVWFKQLFYSS